MISVFCGGVMCPFMSPKMHSMMYGDGYDILCVGVKIFLLVWIIFVPIVITARLDKVVKLLEGKK